MKGGNCHGFSFRGERKIISGYVRSSSTVPHYNTVFDGYQQGFAAELILQDNGYRQIHAQGCKSPLDHYKEDYEPQNFIFPPDN